MKGLLVVLALLVVSGAVGLLVTRVLAGRQLGTGSPYWTIGERESGGLVVLALLPPASAPGPPLILAELDPSAEDFDEQLDDARARAAREAVARNRPLEALEGA
ncbi:hypothetical protein [Paraconexibacter algicola]|uniref:Uncharacterized protein n=2 Tax=Solirubrobacterales TaxID=588673 RepID=A0A2T4UCR4_9ACTN|nr:hypothetical protein [Paraconexibacter algicola]PTL55010.1 hypothetical protein C7Y72_20785 [Paraconexibacter algicola]